MDTFTQIISQQVEKLQKYTCREIEDAVLKKRIDWCKKNIAVISENKKFSPRSAFELLFFTYMGLSAGDLPIICENEDTISWHSKNPCPTLEACVRLGLDTRKICRTAYEKSTQAFLSQCDPQLRFLRSYSEIRPHADHCLEWIVRVEFNGLMRIAIEEAKISRQEGNKGYGAVIVLGDHVLAKGHDTSSTEKDPSLHAEVNVIRQAVRKLGDSNLSGAIMFTTCEPCPMCSSLAVWANLTTIVYGASIADTARLGKSRILVDSREIIDKSPVMVEVIGGVLEEDCLALYR